MSEYVDFYQLKREQTDTGLTAGAKRTMIDLLFDGKKRSDDDIALKRWMAKHHLKSEALNLLMQDCDDNVIREDMVKRVERTRLPKEEALRNMLNLNSSNAVAASARRRVAIAALIGSEEEAKKKAEKRAKGKANQETKAAGKKARREKRQAEKKPKSNKKRDNKGKKN